MMKSTSKRARKYGDKESVSIDKVINKVKVTKKIKHKKVKVIVDGGEIREFKSQKELNSYMDKLNTEADQANYARPSFVFI